MSIDNTVEYNSLSWVKAQLDDVLSDAQTNLNEYIENKTEQNLEHCIEHLQLIYGTLQMVEIYGAAMLAEEMQKTTAALLAGDVESAEDTFDVLMRAMLQLPDYLEGIQAGKKDAPIALMPLFNDLRTARKEGLLSESVLFSPDIKNAELSTDGYDIGAIESGKLQTEVKRLRIHYQLGLLDYIRNKKERVGLQRIKAVLSALEKISSNTEVRQMWMVTSALIEGLIKQGISANLSIKMLLGAIDRQLKLILDDGEYAFEKNYSKELVKNILYYVGLSTVESKAITAVKQAYHLADLIPQESEEAGAMIGGLNADLFDTVSKGITEDLMKVKDVLELYMQGSEQNVEQLASVAEQLGKIADTYGMLGMGNVRQSIMDQRDVMQGIAKGDTEISEPVVAAVAYELLNAESELKDYIAERSGFIDMNRNHEDQTVPAAEYRQVIFTVVSEGLKNFSEAKEALLSYITGIGDKDQLDIILNKLEEVRGVSMMLPLGRVESQIAKLQKYIRVSLLGNARKPDAQEQDTVADVVTSVEYFFEALSEGRPGVEQGLNAGDAAASILDAITQSYGDAIVDVTKSTNKDVETSADDTKKKTAKVKIAAATPEISEEKVGEYSILSDDADDEIVEIFIEEAVEVLGELHIHLPKWEKNNDDEEALAVIRRSFHTLKGSGRLLGADLIGEFSWKFENMLNRIIDNKIIVSDPLFRALDEALAVLPQLVEQLKGNREPIKNIAQLMSLADALAEGREVTNDAVETSEKIPNEDEIAAEIIEITAVDAQAIDAQVDNDNIISIDTTELDDNAFELELTSAEADVSGNDELIDLSVDGFIDDEKIEALPDVVMDSHLIVDDASTNNEFEIEIEEAGDGTSGGTSDGTSALSGVLEIDPMLLKIYYDESVGHVKNIKRLIDESEQKNQPLKADKDLVRAFHTLYGSARTAEVEAIAEVSGVAEKYVKARQESGEEDIPEEITAILKEVEHAISNMLSMVADSKLPANDKNLQDKLNKAVQQEIQTQLQRSWQDNSTSEKTADGIAEDVSIDMSELEPELEPGPAGEKITEVPVEMSYGDIDNELIDIFLEEAEELLENCEDILSEIKSAPNSTEHIHQLQRNMHTLKGGARMAELTPVGDLTHNLESLVVLVDEKKINPDKTLFDLFQESLDALTGMLGNVKKREALGSANSLNNRLEMLMRGEVEEKRSIERFDIELSELEASSDDELEEIDISGLLPESEESENEENAPVAQQDDVPTVKRVGAEKKDAKINEPAVGEQAKENPHWGERASDVNFTESHEQVRVRSDLLNDLVNYAGEVNIYHARLGKQISDFGYNLSELTQTVVRLKEQLRKLEIETEIQIRSGYEKESENFDVNFDPLEMDQYSTLQQLSRSLSETAGDVESINEILTDIARDSETLLLQESRTSTELQEGLMRTRMVRFGGLSSRLRRIVRQIARELGKEVEVDIIGDNSEVDRTVLDRIIAPLEHMIRNAVAHGIELPEARKAQGKNEAGNITIDVDRQGADIVIKVKDDGAGIDVDRVREKAIKLGFMSADTQLSDHDTLQYILQSGFSTVDEVTQVAGRGVGMDVVDSEIKQLGGILEISTKAGKGTEFKIRLPLTLAINQALLVSTIDDVFAIPLSSIEGVVRITGLELQRFYDSENSHYEFNGIEYELKHLGALLTGQQGDYSTQLQLFPVLLVHVGDQYFALHVDDLIGRREIVVKPVGMQIGGVHGIAGATILADGRVVLILEMSALVVADSLFKEHTPVVEEIAVAPEIVDNKKTIMVVDDSITIRKVTERMLLRYGIEVVLAKDGVDATNQLQDFVPDLMLLDIEMPRMDGFEVASFVRGDERLKDLPIIMITSRTGSKHKEKAMKIGVNQYLGKPFQEDDLVKNINEILQTAF